MNHRQARTSYILSLALLILAPSFAQAQSDMTCPDVRVGQFGPYDYRERVKRGKELSMVESVHFPAEVETLKHGHTGSLGADLNYTLTTIPNHHRALDSLSRLSIREKRLFIKDMTCSVDGFFERAARFAPSDAGVYLAYGVHLYRWKKLDRAEQQFLKAEKLAPDDGNVAYNLGLLYVDLKDWDKAMLYADKAYSKGYGLPGLKNKLVSAGKWNPRSGTGSAPALGNSGEPAAKAAQ